MVMTYRVAGLLFATQPSDHLPLLLAMDVAIIMREVTREFIYPDKPSKWNAFGRFDDWDRVLGPVSARGRGRSQEFD